MTVSRKDEHLRVCLEQNVRVLRPGTGLERYRFVHQALPEMDLAEVELRTGFLGASLSAPLLISSMTGGTPAARAINLRLAEAAQAMGIGMAVICSPDNTEQLTRELPEAHVVGEVVKQKGDQRVIIQ